VNIDRLVTSDQPRVDRFAITRRGFRELHVAMITLSLVTGEVRCCKQVSMLAMKSLSAISAKEKLVGSPGQKYKDRPREESFA
jgi:hypothetical protein